MVLVQICLGICVVGCHSVLGGKDYAAKCCQSGQIYAVGMPILLFVVKLENGACEGGQCTASSVL